MYMSKKKKKNKKTINKPLLAIFLIIFILLFDFLVFKLTETGVFTVYNYQTNEPIKTYKHFIFAKNVMKKQEADTICIKNEKNEIVAMKYGVVDFKTKEITENTTYKTNDGKDGYLNGNYGIDALYLQTSNSGKKVQFMMSGTTAWVNIDDVDLYTIDDSPNVSFYEKSEQSLVHYLAQEVKEDTSFPIWIGFAPDFMQDGTRYYSYDGNYFYTDYKTMAKDMKNESFAHAVNKDAYYNFYQYIPHRTYSNITMEAMNGLLTNTRGIVDVASYIPCDPNQSVLFNLGDHFIAIQNNCGVNAAMMFALAINESGFGQSEHAIVNHNLFGHAVYDEAPDRANSYTTFDECLSQHAYYFLQKGYCNPEDERYHGSWFGNKASGINVDYASDPYWGEKAAAFYYQLDGLIGYADYNSIHVETFIADEDIPVYGSEKGRNKLYTYKKGTLVSIALKNPDTIKKDGYRMIYSEVPVENKKKNIDGIYTPDCNGYIMN